MINYCVILMLFWYNPLLTVKLLNKSNLADSFLQNLFENKKIFTSERDLHILFLGLCTVKYILILYLLALHIATRLTSKLFDNEFQFNRKIDDGINDKDAGTERRK